MTAVRRVVLVGAGHAHVEVLRQWAARPVEGAELVLIVDRDVAIYSGMVPGFVAGQYAMDDLQIDAVALARRAGAQVVREPATAVSLRERTIRTASGQAIAYDWASLDVGSRVTGLDRPGVREHALPARPIERLIGGAAETIQRALGRSPSSDPFRLVIVGAGAGGVELAFCFQARLLRETGRASDVMLADRGDTPLPGAHPALQRRVRKAMAKRGLHFRASVDVSALEAGSAVLADGQTLAADAFVWVPGPAAHPFLAETDLPLDARGFVRIAATLQVEGSDRLFAVGDCASLDAMPKAGVYAVRAGPVLAENLRRALAGQPLQPFVPQADFLSLLNLGDGRAIGIKRGFTAEGRWVMHLKDRIDRRFIERYR